MHGLAGVAFATAESRAVGVNAAEPATAVVGACLVRHGRDPDDAARKTALLWSSVHGLVAPTMAGRFSREEGATLVAEATSDACAAWRAQPPSGDGERERRSAPPATCRGLSPGTADDAQAGRS